MLKCLLRDGNGVLSIVSDPERQKLTVKLNESKILTDGKRALGNMLLRLHMYRCTAQVLECRTYYEDLSRVDGKYLQWREIVMVNKLPPLIYLQPNTFLRNGLVVLKEYEASVEGIIQSWVDRSV
jgi:dipeptidyl-peptidase-3